MCYYFLWILSIKLIYMHPLQATKYSKKATRGATGNPINCITDWFITLIFKTPLYSWFSWQRQKARITNKESWIITNYCCSAKPATASVQNLKLSINQAWKAGMIIERDTWFSKSPGAIVLNLTFLLCQSFEVFFLSKVLYYNNFIPPGFWNVPNAVLRSPEISQFYAWSL